MFALKLAAPVSRTVASATSRSCLRPLSSSVSNSRLFEENQSKSVVLPAGVSGLALGAGPLSQVVRGFQTSAVQRDIDSAAKFIGAGAATVGVAGSARKFHSRNKFGKKRKKSLANNFKARLPPGSVDEERDGSPAAADPLPRRSAERADEDRGSVSPTPAADKERFAESPEAADGELGLAGQPACGVTTNSGRVRRDTLMLTPSDLQARQTKADTKLRELASTAATKRKFDFFDDSNDAPASAAPTQQSDKESFFIADIQCLSGLLGVLKCKFCGGGNVSLYKREREYGLAVKVCQLCKLWGHRRRMEFSAGGRRSESESVRREHPCRSSDAVYWQSSSSNE
ncbi:hypothetical protein HPB49_007389 [Dermacentor silvarum]|uniref:Uncharacterized protein n=1 Tax=Dermacentor silvarum TaxID=543639 RepID=A0ACB8CJZ2_DERSI|nr:hypothetical protein HPB49_007389 [Dermacentor silvarum]